MVGRHGHITGDFSRVTLVVFGSVLLYFAWMDLLLYNRIQALQPLRFVPSYQHNPSPDISVNLSSSVFSDSADVSVVQTLSSNGQESTPLHEEASIFSPFAGLSIKLMMMDHLNHYLENPLALAIIKTTHLDSQFLWITPNLLSTVGAILALLAARCTSWDGRVWQLLALTLMFGRGLMDALDGMVARERMGIVRHVSLHNTSGYLVDAVADTLGYSAFLWGCFLFLKRNVPKQYLPLPVLYQGEDKPKRKVESVVSNATNGTQWTPQRIFLVIFCLGLQTACSSLLWDHYCTAYHQLLETPRSSESQSIVQNEVLKSTLMWLVIWLWRIANSHALMNWLLFAILANRMWEFLLYVQFIGFAGITTLFLFTEIHFRDVTAYVNTVP